MIGRNLDLGSIAVHIDRHVVAIDACLDRQIAEELDREDPRFKAAVLLAHHRATFSGDGEGLFRLDVTAQSDRTVDDGEIGDCS